MDFTTTATGFYHRELGRFLQPDPKEFEADPASYDIPDSVIGFLNGELGDPPGGWPEAAGGWRSGS